MTSLTETEPFGSPEGHRSDIGQIRDEFVDFTAANGSAGLALKEDDLTARVIVGKKGSGKTVYLRRAQAYAINDEGLFADDSSHEPPTTAQIIKVGDMHEGGPHHSVLMVETWSGIWKAAILRSLLTKLSHSRYLATDTSREIAESVWRDYPQLCPKELDEISPYSQVRAVIDLFDEGDDLQEYVSNYHWDAIERRIGNALLDCRPVCFYLDAVDEEYRHSPSHWLVCQMGLFYRVMQLLNDRRLGGKLHILICIRDHVYGSLLQSEHLTRIISRSHIRNLDWSWSSIERLLIAKIERLPAEFQLAPDADNPLERWLGTTTVYNVRKKRNEQLLRYLIRHTRLIPRDIVILGNMLSQRALTAKSQEAERLDNEAIWKTVSNAASLFGQEQLSICGNHLAADTMPQGSTKWDGSELYSGKAPEEDRWMEEPDWGSIRKDKETQMYTYLGPEHYDGDDPGFKSRKVYQEMMIEHLKRLSKLLETDRFDRESLLVVRRQSRDFFDSDMMSVLWQSGMLGYNEGDLLTGRPIFFGDIETDPLQLPDNHPGYAVHPALIDCVGLKGIGEPVEPHSARD